MDLRAAYEHCRRIVAAGAKPRYWAALYAPAERRAGLYALYAFDHEIAHVRHRVREPVAGEIRLQWWRDVLAGTRDEEAAAHPVAAALSATIRRHALNVERLLGLIDAHGFALYGEPVATVADFERFAGDTGGAILLLGARLLGVDDEAASGICREAALAQAHAGALERLAQETARGRVVLPLDVLGRYGADAATVLSGEATFELRAGLAELRLRARRHLAAAGALLPRAPQDILPVLLPAALVKPALAHMERRGYEPFAFREPPLWRQQWLIWRAARDPRRIFG